MKNIQETSRKVLDHDLDAIADGFLKFAKDRPFKN